MIKFRSNLEAEFLTNKLPAWVGVGTDPTDYVKTFDDHLHAFDLDKTPDPFPFVVCTVRSVELSGKSNPEIAQPSYDLHQWTVHIYYIDSAITVYEVGKLRRDKIIGKIMKELAKDRRLSNFESTDEDGTSEYIWDMDISSATFDADGQEEYYSFVTELYLTVDSASR